jgi:hypothetical protein
LAKSVEETKHTTAALASMDARVRFDQRLRPIVQEQVGKVFPMLGSDASWGTQLPEQGERDTYEGAQITAMGRWIDDEFPVTKQVECYIPRPKNMALEGRVRRNLMYVVYPDGSAEWITHHRNIDRLDRMVATGLAIRSGTIKEALVTPDDIIAHTGDRLIAAFAKGVGFRTIISLGVLDPIEKMDVHVNRHMLVRLLVDVPRRVHSFLDNKRSGKRSCIEIICDGTDARNRAQTFHVSHLRETLDTGDSHYGTIAVRETDEYCNSSRDFCLLGFHAATFMAARVADGIKGVHIRGRTSDSSSAELRAGQATVLASESRVGTSIVSGRPEALDPACAVPFASPVPV